MSRFAFTLAGAADDTALRARMARDHMKGRVSVSFRREPSYFAGCAVQGEQAQVIKCIDQTNGHLAGLGCRLTLQAYVNGRCRRIGYLSDLRGDEAYRGGTLLARGYRYLRRLHEADPVPLYYSLILEGNTTAIDNLTGARAGLPAYHDHGRLLTPALHLDLAHRSTRERGLRLEQASPAQLPEVMRFVQGEYARRQLAPHYTPEHFDTPRLRGLKARDITLALRGERIVGTLAAWDQRAFRQTHIERYNPALALLRPLYNLLARVTPLKVLPRPGAALPYFYLALAAVEHDDIAVFRALLAHVHEQRRHGPWHYAVAGLHEAHPLAGVLGEFRRIESAGRLFIIHYPEDAAVYQGLDARIPHIEIGAV